MNIVVILLFGILCIPVTFAIAANSRSYSTNKPIVENSHINKENKRTLTINSKDEHSDIRYIRNIGNPKKKKTQKPTQGTYNNKQSGSQKKNDYPLINVVGNGEMYRTPTESPYEIHLDGSQYQTSERFIGQNEPLDELQGKHINVKIKHHHHHHHHNHIKEVIRTVPKPYTVEKVVHIPIEKIIEKIVHVPKIVNVTVEKVVHIPIEKIVEKVIHIPKPVQIPKPYVVEKIVEKIIHVPKPYPVLKTVPYPVEIKVPIPVETKFPTPFKVEVERELPVYIKSREPSNSDELKLNTKLENILNKEQNHLIPKNDYHNRINQYKNEEQHTVTESEQLSEYNHFGLIKNSFFTEQSTSDTEPIPVKLFSNNAEVRIQVIDALTNVSAPISDLDLQTQASMNDFHEIPLSLPIQLVPLKPIRYQQPVGFGIPVATGNR